MEINERIFYLLNKQNKTASSLANYLNIKSSSITGWKNEGSYPSSKYIQKISEFLNVSVDYLVTGNQSIETVPSDQQELLNLYNQLDPIKQAEFKGELKGYLKAKKNQ